MLPIATALNTQSLIVAGWLYEEKLSHEYPFYDTLVRPHKHRLVYYKPSVVVVLSAISLGFGLLSIIVLFVRMLEKKIKWCTRLMIAGAAGQGLFATAAVIAFIIWKSLTYVHGKYTEGCFYSAIAAALSIAVALLSAYHHHLNRRQLYSYTLYELSPSQRQLILLLITSITYTFAMGAAYAGLEGWDFDDGVYWCVSTLATIGFGDLVPQSFTGKVTLPIAASCGIGILAASIYAIRQVALELLTHRLASEYSRSFGIAKEYVPTEEHSPEEGRALSPSPIMHQSWDMFPHSERSVSRRQSIEAAPQTNERRRPAAPQSIPRSRSSDPHVAFSAPNTNMLLNTGHSVYEPTPHSNERPSNIRYSAPAVAESFGLPLSRSFTTSVLEARTMVISRGANLPQLTIVAPADVRRRQVVEATRRTFRQQITFAILAVIANMSVFGGAFSFFEGWHFFEGLYFTFCALTTIGYGDYTLSTVQSRSIFMWFLYIGIGSVTYMFSLMSERALDQWTVTVNKIENRVDRYERKAKLKKLYKNKGLTLGVRRRARKAESTDQESELLGEHEPAIRARQSDDEHPLTSESEFYLSDAQSQEHLPAEAPVWEGIGRPRASPQPLEAEETSKESETPEVAGELELETTPLLGLSIEPPVVGSVRIEPPSPSTLWGRSRGPPLLYRTGTVDSTASSLRGVVRLEAPSTSMQPSDIGHYASFRRVETAPTGTESRRGTESRLLGTGVPVDQYSTDDEEFEVTGRSVRMFSGRKSRRSSMVSRIVQQPISADAAFDGEELNVWCPDDERAAL
ncbi:hypothetical protein SpCBS45565_g00530 [Spizellomyces sp. 'palustris']|nr:hypothetical protein SpCBS45565_g00530 [Spizellomyces sp. 'palustris']